MTKHMLTLKQSRFIDEYLVDLNATQAAIRAGYSENCAAEIGYENLRKPQIAEALGGRLRAFREEREITAQRVQQGLLEIAEDDTASPSARVQAWVWLGKGLGMFTDRVAMGVASSSEVELRVVYDDDQNHGQSPVAAVPTD